MISWDQVRNELKAIQEFDILFLAADEHHKDDCLAFLLRQLRKNELVGFIRALAGSVLARSPSAACGGCVCTAWSQGSVCKIREPLVVRPKRLIAAYPAAWQCDRFL
jgi:hypothetical protein